MEQTVSFRVPVRPLEAVQECSVEVSTNVGSGVHGGAYGGEVIEDIPAPERVVFGGDAVSKDDNGGISLGEFDYQLVKGAGPGFMLYIGDRKALCVCALCEEPVGSGEGEPDCLSPEI